MEGVSGEAERRIESMGSVDETVGWTLSANAHE